MAKNINFDDFEEVVAEDYIVTDEESATADETSSFVDPNSINKEKERSEAKDLVKGLTANPSKSLEFSEMLKNIENYGLEDVERASTAASGILSRSSARSKGSEGKTKALSSLADLRDVVEDLSPHGKDLSPVKKIMGLVPGGNKVRKYFQKFESADQQIEAVYQGLDAGEDGLRRDIAEIFVERKNMLGHVQSLAEKMRVMDQMNAEVDTQIADLEGKGEMEKAKVLKTEVAFAVKQRRQDLATQFGVSAQAFMSLELVEKNNRELVKGVERAKSVTLTALRTAMMVSEALEGQKATLKQLAVVKDHTEGLMRQNAQMLQDNTLKIHENATESVIDPKVLEESFQAIEKTVDAIEKHKESANSAMDATTARLHEQIDKAKGRMKRSIENHVRDSQEHPELSI